MKAIYCEIFPNLPMKSKRTTTKSTRTEIRPGKLSRGIVYLSSRPNILAYSRGEKQHGVNARDAQNAVNLQRTTNVQ